MEERCSVSMEKLEWKVTLHGEELSKVLKDQKCNAGQIRMLRSNKRWKIITTSEGSRMEAKWSYS